MDAGAFSAALAAKPGDAVAAPSEEQQMEQQIKEQSAPKVEKPTVEEKKPDESAKEKTPFDDLPSEEVEKPAEEKVVVEQEVDTSNWPRKQREAFAAARVAQKRLSEELSKAQDAIKQRDVAIEEAKKFGAPEREELERLRAENKKHKEREFADDVKSSDEWRMAVSDPANEAYSSIKEIADSMGVDHETILKATDEPLMWKRIAAIKKVFNAASEASENPLDPIEVQAAAEAVIMESNKLPAIFAKAEELEKSAAEIAVAKAAEKAAQKTEQSKALEADFVKASEHLLPQLKTKWPSLFKDEADAKAVAEARIDTTPEGQALQAQKAALFKPALKELISARAKIAELEKTVSAWKAGRPAVEDKGASTMKPDDGEMDEGAFADALKKRG